MMLDCGGMLLGYAVHYPETIRFFDGYLKTSDECTKADLQFTETISVSKTFLEDNRWLVNPKEMSPSFLEFQALMLETGNCLLKYHRALFHGAALLWRGFAWIITAPSGTGKTTQLRLWKKLLKNDIRIINGDKPLLWCRDDGSVSVFSSPWRGKERYGVKGLTAPLGGIILLSQNQKNEIRRLRPEEAVLPLYMEFITFPETKEQILLQAELLRGILETIPVWKLDNLGDEASAELTLNTIMAKLEGDM